VELKVRRKDGKEVQNVCFSNSFKSEYFMELLPHSSSRRFGCLMRVKAGVTTVDASFLFFYDVITVVYVGTSFVLTVCSLPSMPSMLSRIL
jgi:hypothetical protein